MMLQLGDDGVVSSVNEEELIYVDKNELKQFIDNYHELEKENEQLKSKLSDYRKENYGLLDGMAYRDEVEIPKLSEKISDLECEIEQLKSENEELCNFNLHILLDEKNKEIEQLKQELATQGTRIDFLINENQHMKTVLNENEQLKSEINMLKATIGRNEAYIARLLHKSEWHN